ncbi:hypothetical protein C2I36_16300 [Rhodobacteraceae bacterium WD3A24]|nr:hypothetical protein C2I36_16300 [Rhodobacteraceae bacterium WD3A24]
MKRLVIHIGTHKTGTTSIQEALEKNRARLAAGSVWYARTNRDPHAHLPKHSSLAHALRENTARSAESEISLLLAEFEESGCETLVLSAEGFSELRRESLAPLRELATDFRIDVVCFLRRPDLFAEALWNQFCREGRETRTIRDFVRAKGVRARLRYATLLDNWSAFATVRAADFDAARKTGLLRRFGELADIEMPDSTDIHGNPSPSMNCAAALALLNGSGEAYDMKSILDAFGDDGRRCALGRRLRAEVLEEAAEERARLARDYGVSFDDTMPEESRAPLLRPDPAALAPALARLTRPGLLGRSEGGLRSLLGNRRAGSG